MRPVPLGDATVQEYMQRYQDHYGKPFPLDWMKADFSSGEDAWRLIKRIIERGEPVRSDELVDTKLIYGKKIDLSEYL